MSEKIGKLITCNRCDTAQIFLEKIGEREGGNYSDPGTRIFKYEDLPKEWASINGIGHLCPICASKYQEMMTNFLGYDKYTNLPLNYRYRKDE